MNLLGYGKERECVGTNVTQNLKSSGIFKKISENGMALVKLCWNAQSESATECEEPKKLNLLLELYLSAT